MNKLIRITTTPLSLNILLKGQFCFMKDYFEILIVSSGPCLELDEVGLREGVPTKMVEMSRFISPLKDLKSLWEFYKLCKREKPLIVHSHTPKAGIVGMLGAKLAGVPIRLHTVAGLPLMEAVGIKRKLLDIVEKLTYYCSTKVYPNSKGLFDFILANKYTEVNKLKIISNGSSNGIDTSFFSPEQISAQKKITLKIELNISKNDIVFIFVGRLVGDKGINELIFAFKNLNKSKIKNQKSKLLLVGPFEDELDPLLPETLTEINKNPDVINVGFQNDVRPYFGISDVFVFPSYREGFPNAVLQAGAMGLPSIVTNISGCNELIIDGENGIIIPTKNSEAIYESMMLMITNIAYRSKLKFNARRMIISRYEQQLVWEAILLEYESLKKKAFNSSV
jgi:glycosyltransferase involved in cell wall biosynthesis